MPANNNEIKKIAMGNLSVYCNATEVGMISGDLAFDDGTKIVYVKAAQFGDSDIKGFLKTGNCKIKAKLVTLDPEKLKSIYTAMLFVRGSRGTGIRGSGRPAKAIKENIWTFVLNGVDTDNTIYDQNNMHPKSIQFFKAVADEGYGFKISEDKPYEAEMTIKALPDADKPDYAQFEQSPNIVLPAPSGMFVEMLTPGVNYSALPASITCATLSGSAFTSQIVGGQLNIIITNPGTAATPLLGTFQPLVITGGTATTVATANIFIG